MYISRGQVVISYTGADEKGHFEGSTDIAIESLPGGATIRRLFNIPSVPVPSIKIGGSELNQSISNNEGVTFLECEMGAGELSPMHVTPSIDFGIMISGEIVLILDSGEERTLKPGDIYVQKAANHAWENRTSEPARFGAIMVAARAEKE
ncbi:hypothetical protein BKA66DRAFT_439000 [Pyrenochaeta sp. MPI-SDFR-AT-0127]|nr:hypothetical protein BKA66DRAFT_439000 [Pyrenochaeta sp. MPI-SDFR-AT-0127]